MKIFNRTVLILLLCSINFSSKAQALFTESNCSILYYGYANNQVYFNSKIDTSKVKIIGEGCEIQLKTENMVLIFISFEVMNKKYKNVENPTVYIKLIDKTSEKLVEEKLFTIKRLSEYRAFIDESKEGDHQLILTKGLISFKSPDETNTCFLPRLTEYITSYQITVQGIDEIYTGTGTTIQKKQLKAIKKYKLKNKTTQLPVTLTIDFIDPNDMKQRKKVFSFTY